MTNSIDYGTDFACDSDADELLSTVSGLDVVRQDALHRLLTDDVLGPDGIGWGYDCRKMLGMDPKKVALMGPLLSGVLQQDDRIDSADVAVTVIPGESGLDEVSVSAVCCTAAGPFSLTMNVSDFTASTLVGQE
jgi:hypothetical protein